MTLFPFTQNALGVDLPLTGSGTNILSGPAGGTINGSAGNDLIFSGGGGSKLIGGAGDDYYQVLVPTDQIVELAGQGTDTAYSYANSYTLPANVENLYSGVDGATLIGNAGDNIIAGGAGRQTIDGGAGNNVLSGGAGADVFIINQHAGSDVIGDFENGIDVVRLTDFPALAHFNLVQAAMTQVGADTRLALGGGQVLLFRNHTIADFSANDFWLPLDKSGFKISFDDEFNSFSSAPDGRGGTWQTSYDFGRSLPWNGELQYDSDASVGVNPFSVNNGVLSITMTAGPNPAGAPFNSGLITTERSFAQEYGYFEMRAQLPVGQGLWPAFWLAATTLQATPEADIFERWGDPNTLYTTMHSSDPAANGSVGTLVPNLNTGFHTFGLDWEPDFLRWYLDDRIIYAAATPSDMHQPMFMLATLAMGSSGAGDGSDGTLPAAMQIDYIRAYASANTITAAPVPPGIPPVFSLPIAPHVLFGHSVGMQGLSVSEATAFPLSVTVTVSLGALTLATQPGVTTYTQGTTLLSLSGATADVAAALGHIVYTAPAGGAAPTATDSLTLSGDDGHGGRATQTLAIAVSAPATVSDFNADGYSDLLWQGSDGRIVDWAMHGTTVAGGGTISALDTSWTVLATGDFDGNRTADLLLEKSNGTLVTWQMNGTQIVSSGTVGALGPAWHFLATADIDGSGKSDLLWQNTDGRILAWTMDGSRIAGGGVIGALDSSWSFKGTGDFNADGKSDMLWQRADGSVFEFAMNGAQITATTPIGTVGADWKLLSVADFNGDGAADILWRKVDGSVLIWQMHGTQIGAGNGMVGGLDNSWSFRTTGDYNNDGRADIVWQNVDGRVVLWEMNGTQIISSGLVGAVGSDWHLHA